MIDNLKKYSIFGPVEREASKASLLASDIKIFKILLSVSQKIVVRFFSYFV